FFRKDHLAEHFTTHTKTLPFHCPVCNRGFQRQIAMRAHFQNEHVGQHDLVKTCPMCSYRAGTMKSLRVHFFNRHGIDLDNPGARSPPSLLLALSTNSKTPFLPSTVAAAAAAAAAASSSSAGATVTYSDSGESFRSVDNTTPPLNLLTPQVEILTTDTEKSLKAMSCNDELQISPVEPKESNIPTDYSPNSPYGDGNSSSNHINEKIPIDDKNSIKPLISLFQLKMRMLEMNLIIKWILVIVSLGTHQSFR
uniref:C2H2-type domain-containing protein n=1 Tax=Megaselia scalaris TaxID=36166 RepID=T1GUY7_MEGSC